MTAPMIDAAMDSVGFTRKPAINQTIGGKKPGPVVLVSGTDPVMSRLSARILDVDSLIFLNGTLLLAEAGISAETIMADDVVFLPALDEADDVDAAVKDAWWAVFGTLRRLGMISGRGVPLDA